MERIGNKTPQPSLDAVFAAAADPTRRAILHRLSRGQASVNELAGLFAISQPAVSKHLKVLENAGLITRGVDRQTRPAKLNAAPIQSAVAWLDQGWGKGMEVLEALLADLQG